MKSPNAFDPNRRALLAAAAGLPLAGCSPTDASPLKGGWVGAQVDRGHLLRGLKSGNLPPPAVQRRAGVIVVGAGIAGLGAARALMRAGIDDVQVFDLEDNAGGNSRGHRMSGIACPLGAHYLPLPGERAVEVIELLEDFGLRTTEHGRPVYDEMHLCHSPQERLFIDGHWHDGLLPPIDALPAGERAATLAQYRRFATAVDRISAGGAFAIPTARSEWTPALAALDGVTFAAWLDHEGLDAPALRWYLDYCCRDDYGAGAAAVSAWAGLHYFASRHGFHAPGDGDETLEPVLTWPEGNAWLAERLAAPLGARLRTGKVAWRVVERDDEVDVDFFDVQEKRVERWTARQVVLAIPLFVAARLLAAPPPALVPAAASMRHAPWLVGNLHVEEPLDDHPGAAPSWDNVLYDPGRPGSGSLGYVDAMHQSTRMYPGPTVLTAYRSLGGDDDVQLVASRARLLNEPWQAWAKRLIGDLARAHPDLPIKVRRADLMRYGHGMSIPVPGVRASAALQALAAPQRRVHFAHADLSSYSVFEEALHHGSRAALHVGQAFAGWSALPVAVSQRASD